MSSAADDRVTNNNNKDNNNGVQTHSKRNRAQLSCNHCRHGKLKCDRRWPCDQCIKRDKDALCAYPPPPPRQKAAKNMHKRLHHLESLVLDIMKNGSPIDTLQGDVHAPGGPNPQALNPNDLAVPVTTGILPPTASDEVSQATNAFGRVVLNPTQTTYVGATHWAAILEDIEEVRDYFDDGVADDIYDSKDNFLTTHQEAPAMLLGISKATNKAGLLAALPDRFVVDRLLSRYFKSAHPGMNLIHKPTFQKEYQEFWLNPDEQPVMWLGLLFAIMSLATFFNYRAADEPIEFRAQPMDLIRTYRSLCSSSLVLGNYTKPGKYTLETLILYFEGEFTMTGDAQARGWLLHGLTVRLALRMGLHRDATHHQNISVFQGEMRRRVWHLISQVDLLLSFHVGLPSMIQGIQSDTLPPHNLFDDDFGPASTELKSRPETELTPMTYTICKSRIALAFGRIADMANALITPPYQEIMEVDKQLHNAYSSVPPVLRARSLDQSITDSSEILMCRFNIVLLFHKSRCVLHRKYLAPDNTDPKFNYSRSSCIDSALEILHYQYIIHEATAPGGPLSRDRWYLNTLTIHDFLLASMIIYLFLIDGTNARQASNGTNSRLYGQSIEQDMIKVLETSHEIWVNCTTTTGDSIKARRVLDGMLRGLSIRGFSVRTPPEQLSSSELSADHLDMSLNGLSDSTANYDSLSPMPIEELGSLLNMPTNFDWGTWDSQVNTVDENLQFWPSDDELNGLSVPTTSTSQIPPNTAFSVLQAMRYEDPYGILNHQ